MKKNKIVLLRDESSWSYLAARWPSSNSDKKNARALEKTHCHSAEALGEPYYDGESLFACSVATARTGPFGVSMLNSCKVSFCAFVPSDRLYA